MGGPGQWRPPVTATSMDPRRLASPRPLARRPAWLARASVGPWLLLLPALLFLGGFFVLPALNMIAYSLLTQSEQGVAIGPITLANYARFFGVDLYLKVLRTTLEVSLATTLVGAFLAYPVALVMVRGNALVMRLITALVLAPLLINVVIRTYGWKVILANGDNGLLNWLLGSLGLIDGPLHLLYTETAIVIGSLHVYFPLMVLPLATALAKIDPKVEDAARTLGASDWRVFCRITLPLSLPGLAVGTTLMFSLTACSFVTPAILGGNFAKMLGTLVEEQILAVYDWPFGATIATVLVALVLGINLVYAWLIERRFKARAAAS